jgi:serine/threonine protein kinase/tetratricopeptide (TPR) repeat protein
MTTPMHERWRELSQHLDQVLDLPEADRGPWLTALRDGDPEMAALLEQALKIRGSAGFDQFLEGPSPLAGTASNAALVGRHIGPYIIDAEVGSGGMGSVWRAHRADGRYEAEVAIKFVHAAWMGQAGEQRFQFEGRALARLNHPNIARLLDAGVAEVKQPYLVLEYVQGEPIDVYCEREQLDVRARVKLFINVLQAVAHAHANLIVHRDIKPSNVYVKSDGTVKLLDFGIAKLIDSDGEPAVHLTRASAVALTPQYAAPEQLLGQPISTVTDVYALGLLLYVLLTGEHPVPKGTRSSAALVQAVLTDEPARASAVSKIEVVPSKSLQGDLDNILHKAIKKNPAERYASVDAFAEDLQRYLTDQPVQARPDTAAYRVSKFIKRHRVGTALGSLALLALTASVVIATVQAARAERAAAHAIEEKTRADKAAADAIEQRDIALEGIAQAQDATHLATFMLADALPADRQEFTRKILLKAADVVRGSKELQPNRRAVLLNILGDQLESRRDYEAAFPLYSEAATLALQVNDVDIGASALCRAGSTDALLNRAADGMQKIEKGLAILPHQQINARTRIDCYLAKAQALAAQGLPTLEVAEAAQQELPDVNPPDLLEDEHVLGLLTSGYVRAMRATDAKKAFAQEETIMVTAGHENDRDVGVHFHNQGMFEWKIGRPLDARTDIDRVMAIEKARGDTQIQPLGILLQARIADELGDLRAAIGKYQQAGAGARAMQDVTVETTANAELLSTLIEAGDYARAGVLFPRVERALHAEYSPSHWWFGVLKMDAALLADHAGNEAQAQGLADDALVMFHENSPPTYLFPVVLVKHSEFELRHGHTGEAKSDAEHALAVYERTFGKDILSSCIADAFMAEGRALAAKGEAEAARDRFAKAARHYDDSLGADNDKTKTAKRLAAT